MRTSRREFIEIAGVALISGPTGQSGPGVALGPDEGERVYVGTTRDPVRVKLGADRGQPFGMITQQMAAGSRIPVHLHEKEDELIFIQSGQGIARLGDERVAVQAGAALFVPRGTWHGGENTGSAVLDWIAVYAPAGFERYFLEIGSRTPAGTPPRFTVEQMNTLDRRYGIRYLR